MNGEKVGKKKKTPTHLSFPSLHYGFGKITHNSKNSYGNYRPRVKGRARERVKNAPLISSIANKA